MKDELKKLKLPEKYIEVLFDYKEGLDNTLEWIDLLQKCIEEYNRI